MSEEIDRAYMEGRRRTLINQLTHTLGELQACNAGDDPLVKLAQYAAERQEAIQKLRSICAEWGDNDWDDNLHLADILDKHLENHFSEEGEADPD